MAPIPKALTSSSAKAGNIAINPPFSEQVPDVMSYPLSVDKVV
jgi:hypothetical protein